MLLNDGRKPTAALFVALLFSSHIASVLSCTGEGCMISMAIFTALVQGFGILYDPTAGVQYSSNYVVKPQKIEMKVNLLDLVSCINCSYLCPLSEIDNDSQQFFLNNTAIYNYTTGIPQPFPAILYGVCMWSTCESSNSLLCLQQKREATDSAGIGESSSATALTMNEEDISSATALPMPMNEDVSPRGVLYSAPGSCTVGPPADCVYDAQCCNHAMGGQTFLCMLGCGLDFDAGIDCMNTVFNNYCTCLGVC